MTSITRLKFARAMNPDWKVTVQAPQTYSRPDGSSITGGGYTQFDKKLPQYGMRGNVWSSGPGRMQAKGYNVPNFTGLPEGQHSIGEASQMLTRRTAGIPPNYSRMLGEMPATAPGIFQQIKPFLGGKPVNTLPILKSIRRAGIVPQMGTLLKSLSRIR